MSEMSPEHDQTFETLARARAVHELEYWVDRLLTMLDESPGTTEFITERFGPIAWCIDHLREVRFGCEHAWFYDGEDETAVCTLCGRVDAP